MVPNQFIFYVYLCFEITKVQSSTATEEDLIDQYYTITPTTIDHYIPQDDIDAKAIIKSDKDDRVIASILPYRDKVRRHAITIKIFAMVMVGGTRWQRRRQRHYWIRDDYSPQTASSFYDLCYGLTKHDNIVLGGYLTNFFNHKDETLIIIGMILVKDIQALISDYDSWHTEGHNFKDLRKHQRHPFENMLRVWVRQNREPVEIGKLNHDSVVSDAQALEKEQNDGGWAKKRHQIELILMQKSIKYARAVIQEFEKANENRAIEDIITENVNRHGLNHDLADAYASLARYIKDKYSYIARILRQYSDGTDMWAIWIMCIAVLHPQEWPEVDEAFKKDHPDDSLSKFILQKIPDYKLMAEMIALIVDSKFKPTTFSEYQNNSSTTHSTAMPPPAPPTMLVPPPTLSV